jgi:maltooligosyltrehalose synthase
MIVEKILTGNETLPKEWPVHGTTGYDFQPSYATARRCTG